MKKRSILLFLAAFLFSVIASSCGATEPTYKKNTGLNKSKHSTVARTPRSGVFCK